jgi:hypothetical protein
MAAKKFGNAGKLLLQVGAEVSEEQDHSLKGTASFEGDADYYYQRPKRGDPHPRVKGLACYALKTRWLNAKKVRVDAEYIGLETDPTPYFQEFVGSIGEEAVETHPNFAAVIGGTPDAPLHGAKFDAETNEFLGFPANAPEHLGGVRTYYRPSVIVRISYWQYDAPNPAALGHVIDPSYVPDLILPADCQNLLVTNFGYRTLSPRTPPYQLTVEMLASGPLGWNTQIYSFA